MAEKNLSGKESPKAPNLVRMVIIGALLAVALIWGRKQTLSLLPLC